MAGMFGTLIVVLGGLPEGLQGLIQTTLSVVPCLGARRPGPDARPVRQAMEDRRASSRPSARSGRGGRRRRARTDRPRAARHRGPPCQRDRHPGRRRAARDRPPTGGGTDRDRGGRADRVARRSPTCAGCSGSSATARRPPRARWRRCPGSIGSASSSRRSASPACRSSSSVQGERRPLDAGRRAVGLPHRPGGADQRPQARARAPARGSTCATCRAALEIEVVDEGGSGPRDVGDPVHEGRGLIGMHERAALFGGRLEAGPDADRVPRRPRACPIEPAGGDRRMTIRVLLVDDQQLVRTGFRMILEDEPTSTVVGEAATDRPPSRPPGGLRPDVDRHGHPDAGPRRHRGDPPARARRCRCPMPGSWS